MWKSRLKRLTRPIPSILYIMYFVQTINIRYTFIPDPLNLLNITFGVGLLVSLALVSFSFFYKGNCVNKVCSIGLIPLIITSFLFRYFYPEKTESNIETYFILLLSIEVFIAGIISIYFSLNGCCKNKINDNTNRDSNKRSIHTFGTSK